MKQPKIYSILPKLLHRIPETIPLSVKATTKTDQFFTFFDTRMDFYLRKVLKYNNVNYTWQSKRRLLTVNYTGSPFKFFMIFDDSTNYITIRRIPVDDWEYQINAITIDELIEKMIRFRIIHLNNSKKYLIVPIHLKAEQRKLMYI